MDKITGSRISSRLKSMNWRKTTALSFAGVACALPRPTVPGSRGIDQSETAGLLGESIREAVKTAIGQKGCIDEGESCVVEKARAKQRQAKCRRKTTWHTRGDWRSKFGLQTCPLDDSDHETSKAEVLWKVH